MSVPAAKQHILINSRAIIANPEAQTAMIIGDFSFDFRRLRMLKSICQCFLPYSVYLVANRWIEGLWCSYNAKAEPDCMILSELISACNQPSLQFVSRYLLMPKVANTFPSLE